MKLTKEHIGKRVDLPDVGLTNGLIVFIHNWFAWIDWGRNYNVIHGVKANWIIKDSESEPIDDVAMEKRRKGNSDFCEHCNQWLYECARKP